MSVSRLLTHLLLVLALVAGGLASASAGLDADTGTGAQVEAPCHGGGQPAPDGADDGGCCGDTAPACQCDCLHHVATAPPPAHGLPMPPPLGLRAERLPGGHVRAAPGPAVRPPIA